MAEDFNRRSWSSSGDRELHVYLLKDHELDWIWAIHGYTWYLSTNLSSPKDLRGTPEIGFRCDTFSFEIFWDILSFICFFCLFLFVFVYFCLFLFIFVYCCLWLFMFVYFCLFLFIFACCTVGFTVVKSMLTINIHHHSIIINRITHAEKMKIVSFKKHIWYNHLKSNIVSNNNQMWHCYENVFYGLNLTMDSTYRHWQKRKLCKQRHVQHMSACMVRLIGIDLFCSHLMFFLTIWLSRLNKKQTTLQSFAQTIASAKYLR